MRTFTTTLDPKSINNLIKDLNEYKKVTLQDKIEGFVKALAEEGVTIAQYQIYDWDAIFTGELMKSMSAQKVSRKNNRCVFVVKADNTHAAFVEFGTGYIGQAIPYPYPFPKGAKGIDSETGASVSVRNWKYVSGQQVVANAKEGIYGWYYPGRDGRWYFCEGMQARPFMYHTFLELQTKVEKIAKAYF